MAEHSELPWNALHQYIFRKGGRALPVAAGYHEYVTSPGGQHYQEAQANAAFIVLAANSHHKLADALKLIEYVSRKDSLTDHERLQSVRTVVLSALTNLKEASDA